MGNSEKVKQKQQHNESPKKIPEDDENEEDPLLDNLELEEYLECGEDLQKEHEKSTEPDKLQENHLRQLKQWNREGIKLYREKKIQVAEIFFREALRIDPENSAVLYNLGFILSKTNKLAQAIDSLEKSVKYNPLNQKALSGLAVLLIKTKKYQQSIIYFTIAIEINPNLPRLYNLLGIAFQKINENTQAKQNFAKAIELDPKSFRYYFNMARTLKKEGEIDCAIASYQQVIKLKENFEPAYSCLGNIHYKRKEIQKATQYYRVAAELKPTWIRYFNYGCCLQRAKRVAQALECFRKCLEMNPKHQKAQAKITKLEGITAK